MKTQSTGSVLALAILAMAAATMAQAAPKVLVDFGRAGQWYSGATPASPDANGNHWTSVDSAAYFTNLPNNSGVATTVDFGFITGSVPAFTAYNGPAGATTNPATQLQIDATAINATALGVLGVKEAAFDYAHGTDRRFVINELDPAKIYRLVFFSSRKFEGDAATVFSVFNANTFDPGALLDSGTLAHRSPTPVSNSVHNQDTVLAISNLSPSAGGSLYVNFTGDAGGAGAVNSMYIEEVDTVPPVITLTGNNPLEVLVGTTFSDPGATVTDNIDATRSITGTGTVDTATPGTYTLTYSTTDEEGNAATPVERTVIVRRAVARTVLVDFGRSPGWYSGANPTSPDANGNHWNSLDSSAYWTNLTDSTGAATTVDSGFATSQPTMIFGHYNGPAGASTNPADVAINPTALGKLGINEAAFDYVGGTDIKFVLNELNANKSYRLTFFSSRKYEGDAATVIGVYNANTYDAPALLQSGTLAHRDASDGNAHNQATVLVLDNLTPSAGNALYVKFSGANGGVGVLNCLAVEELQSADTTAPVITVAGDNPASVIWGAVYADAGASAMDDVDGSVGVNATGTVNTAVLGTYTINYAATDAASNTGTASRTVNVVMPPNATVPGADGYSPLVKYAFGASGPDAAVIPPVTSTSGGNVLYTAIIRTNDPTLVVIGEYGNNLQDWLPLPLNPTGVPSVDQSGVPAGTQRRVFTLPGGDPALFLRLSITTPY